MIVRLSDGEEIQVKIPPVHSPDYRSANWYGRLFSFTPNQAAVVRILWDAWEQGAPEVSQEYIVTEAVIETEKLSQLFHQHPAWKSMIVPGASRNTVRIADSDIPAA